MNLMKNLLNITHFSSSLLLLSSFSFGSVSVTISNSGSKTLFDAPVQLSSDSFLPIENYRITNQLYNYLFDSINTYQLQCLYKLVYVHSSSELTDDAVSNTTHSYTDHI